jgi:Mo-co oxidoreductase dimerisation domain
VLRGAAWGGAGVATVEVRVDGGRWRQADLEPGRGRWALRRWSLPWAATPGDHRLDVRATDLVGERQPDHSAWNRAGYANNAVHGVDVRVG